MLEEFAKKTPSKTTTQLLSSSHPCSLPSHPFTNSPPPSFSQFCHYTFQLRFQTSFRAPDSGLSLAISFLLSSKKKPSLLGLELNLWGSSRSVRKYGNASCMSVIQDGSCLGAQWRARHLQVVLSLCHNTVLCTCLLPVEGTLDYGI